MPHIQIHDIDGLVQERCNSIANALELRLSGTNPSICLTSVSDVKWLFPAVSHGINQRNACTQFLTMKLYKWIQNLFRPFLFFITQNSLQSINIAIANSVHWLEHCLLIMWIFIVIIYIFPHLWTDIFILKQFQLLLKKCLSWTVTGIWWLFS